MRRQINFFLLNEDETEFLEYIHSLGDGIISSRGCPLNNEDITGQNMAQVYIKLSQSIIKIRESGYLETFESNVIEYCRTRMSGLQRYDNGRLWVELYDFNEAGYPFKKEKWLEDKYVLYKKWIIKHARISKNKYFYIGDAAYKLYKQGYHMMSTPKYEVSFD
jgi:hypothetical protein